MHWSSLGLHWPGGGEPQKIVVLTQKKEESNVDNDLIAGSFVLMGVIIKKEEVALEC